MIALILSTSGSPLTLKRSISHSRSASLTSSRCAAIFLALACILREAIAAADAQSWLARVPTQHLQEARRLLTLTHYAQSPAVAEGVPIEVWFDATNNRYGATIGAGFSTEDPRAVAYEVDADIIVSLTTEEGPEPYEVTETFESAPDIAVVFLPDGLVQPDSATLLRLEHTDGNALNVALNQMGTSYEILSDDDLAQP